MWVGSIEDLKNYDGLSEEVKMRVIEFLKTNDLKALGNGKRDLGNGNYVNIFEYDTKENDGAFEVHKAYIDIHCVISGEEKILWSDKYTEEIKTYQVDEDYSLAAVRNPSAVEMENRLCLFEIGEPHKAGVCLKAVSHVKKAVFKIRSAYHIKKNNYTRIQDIDKNFDTTFQCP